MLGTIKIRKTCGLFIKKFNKYVGDKFCQVHD